MDAQDVTRLLLTATVLDPRLSPPSPDDAKARVVAWGMALDPDLPVADAEQIIVSHYRESTRGIMPADINQRWRSLRAMRRETARAARLEEERRRAEIDAVPMPDSVRAAIREITARREIEDGGNGSE